MLLIAYAIDDAPAVVWDCIHQFCAPLEFANAIEHAETVVIHNSHFDRTVLRHALGIDIDTSRIHDTMIQALSHSLPAGLGDLCAVLGIVGDDAKDKDGKKLINLFCKPQAANRAVRKAHRGTHPGEWDRFIDYARRDVEAMRTAKRKMPVLNNTHTEHKLWELDQKINDRGIMIDMDLVRGAINAVDTKQIFLAQQTLEMTDGLLGSTTQRNAFLKTIEESFGIFMPDLTMGTVKKYIADPDIPSGLKDLLAIRQQASTTSTSKYKTLLKGTSSDGRLRGTLQFNGASRTGRWAGRLFQPQNLPRPTLKQAEIDIGVAALKAGCLHLVADNVMELTSSAIRGTIIAKPSHKLVIADLANIEGRVQAWLAGEEWKLQAFRDFDAGVGPDLYKLAYSKSFGIDPKDVTKDQRQIGKVQELALAYAGGVGAFETFATAYGIDLELLANGVLQNALAALIEEADKWLYVYKKTNNGKGYAGLSDDAFVACDVLKRAWRLAHPAISSYWGALTNAVNLAMLQKGTAICILGLEIRVTTSGSWLTIRMPSGRVLCYASPKITNQGLSYMGQNQLTRKWERITTHGGKLFENLCQAVARDVMTTNMPAIDDAGYLIGLTVHDEIISECPDTPEYNSDHLSQMMAAQPWWARDMPLAAAGFETYRYRKE